MKQVWMQELWQEVKANFFLIALVIFVMCEMRQGR